MSNCHQWQSQICFKWYESFEPFMSPLRSCPFCQPKHIHDPFGLYMAQLAILRPFFSMMKFMSHFYDSVAPLMCLWLYQLFAPLCLYRHPVYGGFGVFVAGSPSLPNCGLRFGNYIMCRLSGTTYFSENTNICKLPEFP